MLEKKAILIVNPKTGRYGLRKSQDLEQVAEYLRTDGFEVSLQLTSAPGEATRMASAATRSGMTNLIIAGGDGTINEALQGLIGTKARLGILPCGTANVLAHELTLPTDIKQAAGVIARGKTRRIYVGCAIDQMSGRNRYFLLMAGIGLDASIVRGVHPGLKKRFGKAAFWVSGLSHLARWQPSNFTLQVDGKNFPATFAIVGKAAKYGGNLAVTPRAQMDRQEFEICIINSRSRLRHLQLLSYVMRSGVPADIPGVCFLQATNVCATGDAPVQIDGEVIGDLPMSFEIAPETVEVFVP